MTTLDRFKGCLLGLAVGDALGTSVEFMARDSFDPLTSVVGGGPFNLRPGEWTDDTSMALCLGASLTEKRGFDPVDQLDKYRAWKETGYMSSNGKCFDIGLTVSEALTRYRFTGNPYSGSTDPNKAGNGCVMRLAPVPMFFYPDLKASVFFSGESSRTTHGAQECIDGSRLLGACLFNALLGMAKEEVVSPDLSPYKLAPNLERIRRGDWKANPRDEIQSTGYVVHTLEAAVWCFYHTNSFRDAVLEAANLGDDADTVAAVCGQIAGAYYGAAAIPEEWRRILAKSQEITDMAVKLCQETGA